MKEEIYTIPVVDGFRETSECPLCSMRRALEEKTVAYFLSPAYMEEEVRDETNAYGFCRPHASALFASRNTLGVSLMIQSHLALRHRELSETVKKIGKEKKPAKKDELLSAFSRKLSDCALCRRIDDTMEQYLSTFFFLWRKQEDFRETVTGCRGFCLDHFAELFEKASEHLPAGKAEEFRALLASLEDKELTRVREDLDWLIKKFDYRYADEPWKESRDALPRALTKTEGGFFEK